jgi:hypothetical protein
MPAGRGRFTVKPRPSVHTDLAERARTRIEGKGVRGDVEDARIGLEHVLRAVAVMHVEVDDDHAREAAGQGMGGGDRDVVEEAEAHRAVRFRVVPGRAHEAQRAVQSAVEDALDRVRGRARRLEGGGIRTRSGLGVGIEAPRPARGGARRWRHVRPPCTRRSSSRVASRGGELEARFEAFAPDPLAQRDQTLRPLRMPRPGVVLEEDGIVVEADLQRSERISRAAALSLGSTSNTSPTIP